MPQKIKDGAFRKLKLPDGKMKECFLEECEGVFYANFVDGKREVLGKINALEIKSMLPREVKAFQDKYYDCGNSLYARYSRKCRKILNIEKWPHELVMIAKNKMTMEQLEEIAKAEEKLVKIGRMTEKQDYYLKKLKRKPTSQSFREVGLFVQGYYGRKLVKTQKEIIKRLRKK